MKIHPQSKPAQKRRHHQDSTRRRGCIVSGEVTGSRRYAPG